MTKDEWIEIFSKPVNKIRVNELALYGSQNDIAIKDLMSITLHDTPEIAFRAAWVLENSVLCYEKNYSINELVGYYLKQNNFSCMRHYTKIMMFLVKRGKILMTKDSDKVIDLTFEWLINPTTPVAVKVNCLDILYGFKDYSDWIVEELPSQIQFHLKDGTAAMQSRGKKLLKHLRC
ncbi:MAG: hypothetical protein H7Y07_17130 [Pyrinomonadaceae bacterium]|nr:hypothetical protein [Sphingobacteriaceae bacterium]